MYFNRITLKPDAATNKSFWDIFSNDYAIHQIIWNLFSTTPDMKRDFIYRQEVMQKKPVFYAVSSSLPPAPSPLWNIESKEYAPIINEGQRLSFSLRANPIVSKRDQSDRQHRHDVIMDLKTRYRTGNEQVCSIPGDIVTEAGVAWLKKKAVQNGFEFNPLNVIVGGYQQRKFKKPKNSHRISISTLDYTGILTITDVEPFREALYKGIGPAKSFGCGMMMIKRL